MMLFILIYQYLIMQIYTLLVNMYIVITNVRYERNYIAVGAHDGVVVKALRYKPAGRGFDSRWCHWNFSLT